jgi:DNA-binding response OmpR family regulator
VCPVVLDPTTRSVRVWGKQLDPPLSQIQYDFLAVLAEDPGRVYTRDETVCGVWPMEDLNAISDDAINALVHRLRGRLREHEPQHEFIATLRGYGFRLDLP